MNLPGLNIELSIENLKEYKKKHPYGDMTLRQWALELYNVPPYQPLESIGIVEQNLEGQDLSFIDFNGITIDKCQIDEATIFAGASFNKAIVHKTPLGNANNLGFAEMPGIQIDEESAKSIDDHKLSEEISKISRAVNQYREYILMSDDEIKAKQEHDPAAKEFLEGKNTPGTTLYIVANSDIIKQRAVLYKKSQEQSLWSKGWNTLSGAVYDSVAAAKKTAIGATIGAAIGATQGSSLKGAAAKGALGAALGAVAVNKIPEKYSPSAPSDWPVIAPEDKAARGRDMKLKLRGLFWCSMLAGGAIEGITDKTLGIGPISTVVSSFGLVKKMLPIQEFNIAEDPQNIESFAEKGVKKLDSILSKYSESFDSQLGDRLLEIGTIMEQIEPRLGIILANRQLMKITEFGSPGLFGNILSTGEWMQNFFSFWSIKNNYYTITDALKKEKEKEFIKRERPGSKKFTKEIEEKMWLKKVTTRSIFTIAAVSIAVTLGIAAIPALGLAASAIGAKATIISVTAAIALASTGYVGYSVFKGTTATSMSSVIKAEKPEKKEAQKPDGQKIRSLEEEKSTPSQNAHMEASPTPSTVKKPTIPEFDPAHPKPGGFVDKLNQQRGKAPAQAQPDQAATPAQETKPPTQPQEQPTAQVEKPAVKLGQHARREQQRATRGQIDTVKKAL